MKFEQLRYVAAIYRTGSISKAAKELFLSQPNISNAVKNLETELGFQILERTANGIVFTEKGLDLVYHAQSILREADLVMGLSDRKEGMMFRILSPRYTPVEDAFLKLYKENETQPMLQMAIQDSNQYESIELLSKKQMDVAFLISSDIQAPIMKAELRRKRLQYNHLCALQCNINLSKDHPLARQEHLRLADFKNYPFITYSERNTNHSPYSVVTQFNFVDASKLIKCDSRVLRSRFVSESAAYSIGVELPPKRLNELGWKCIPIEGCTLDFGYLVHKDFKGTAVLKRYLELLRDEMDFVGDLLENKGEGKE